MSGMQSGVWHCSYAGLVEYPLTPVQQVHVQKGRRGIKEDIVNVLAMRVVLQVDLKLSVHVTGHLPACRQVQALPVL